MPRDGDGGEGGFWTAQECGLKAGLAFLEGEATSRAVDDEGRFSFLIEDRDMRIGARGGAGEDDAREGELTDGGGAAKPDSTDHEPSFRE